jgi:transcriptional regulator with XRE-family HTH domain
MIENSNRYKKEIGDRFRIFRQLVLKTKREFANESSLPEDYIAQIEWGDVLPGILSIEYFCKEYGLNLTWLVTGEDRIFSRMGPRTPRHAYQIDRVMDYKDPEFKECITVVSQMRIPEVKEDLIAIMKQIRNDYQQFFKYYENQNITHKIKNREVTNG